MNTDFDEVILENYISCIKSRKTCILEMEHLKKNIYHQGYEFQYQIHQNYLRNLQENLSCLEKSLPKQLVKEIKSRNMSYLRKNLPMHLLNEMEYL